MWIGADDRLPTKEDADEYGCVIAWHMFQGVIVTGWHQVGSSTIRHWMHTPKAPDDADEQRESYNARMGMRANKKTSI